MFGFGVRTSQVFTSRWKALLWAAGVMLTAYCTVPAAPSQEAKDGTAATDASGLTQQQKDDVDAALKALNEAGK